jgi:hypothetical protein
LIAHDVFQEEPLCLELVRKIDRFKPKNSGAAEKIENKRDDAKLDCAWCLDCGSETSPQKLG